MKIRTRIILILFISLIVFFVVFMNVSTLLYRSVDPGLIQQKISAFKEEHPPLGIIVIDEEGRPLGTSLDKEYIKEEIPENFDLLELVAFLGWRKDSRLSFYLKPINRAGKAKGFVMAGISYTDAGPIYIQASSEGVKLILYIILSGIIIAIVTTMLLSYLLTLKLNRRFSSLSEAISQISLGNLSFSTHDTAKDEFGDISRRLEDIVHRMRGDYLQVQSLQKEQHRMTADLSHDLRTPLSSIMGYAEAIRDNINTDEKERSEQAEIIRKKAVYMEHILEDLLDHSRGELSSFSFSPRRANLSELLRQSLISVLPRLEEADIDYSIDLPEEEVFVRADPKHLERILNNLIDNAIRHGGSGKYLGLALKCDESRYFVSVIDRG